MTSSRDSRERSPLERNRARKSSTNEGTTGGAKVFITNLPFEANWQELKDLFRDKIGGVNYAEMYLDESGRPRGTGIVELSTAELAAEAIRTFDKYEWKGRVLTVREALNVDRDKYGRIVKGGQSGAGRSSNGVLLRKIYVANLPYEVRWGELKDLFREEVGNVTYVELFNDENGKPRGCGLMEFETEELAKKAIKRMNKFELKGRPISVQEALDVERDRYGYPITNKGGAGRSGNNNMNRGGGGGGGGGDYHSGNMNFGNTYGLSGDFLASLGIDGPLHSKLYIGNLNFDVDEKKIREVFRLAGKIITIELIRDKEGKSRGFGMVEFTHAVEAVQAISMFNNQKLFDRPMNVRLDREPPKEEDGRLPDRLPEGLANVGMGLGDRGKPLANILQRMNQCQQSSNGGTNPVDLVSASAKTLAELTPALALLAQQVKMNVPPAPNPMPYQGYPSTPSGYGNQAAGYGSQASGYGSQAAGYGSQAAGYGSQASGYQDPMSGQGNQTGYSSSTYGSYTQSSGNFESSFNLSQNNADISRTSTALTGNPDTRFTGADAPYNPEDFDTIICRNLPVEFRNHDLHDLFSSFGEMKNAIMKDVGVGIVRYASSRMAQRALELNGISKWGKVLDVRMF